MARADEPREGEVAVDCGKVRKLLLQDCRLTRSGAERRLLGKVTHGVWHRMSGRSRS